MPSRCYTVISDLIVQTHIFCVMQPRLAELVVATWNAKTFWLLRLSQCVLSTWRGPPPHANPATAVFAQQRYDVSAPNFEENQRFCCAAMVTNTSAATPFLLLQHGHVGCRFSDRACTAR